MKLLSVKILGDDFRSLKANKLYEFNRSSATDRISSKVFAGLNGSGKSNFLELISEIFYYLEIYHLEETSKIQAANLGFGFEIEYEIPFDYKRSQWAHNENEYGDDDHQLEAIEAVRIIKPVNEKPEFLIKWPSINGFLRADDNTHLYLPTKIIAYTSGQNELISNPYLKLQYHYFKEFEKLHEKKPISSFHRMLFLNYSTNFSVFIANMLLGNTDKTAYLCNILRIKQVQSFRITINTDELYKRVIPVNKELAQSLQYLKNCATTWVDKKYEKHNLLILDFYVTQATKDAFTYFFKDAFTLFKVFYELEIFNLYLVDKKTRDLMLQVHKTFNFSDELPKPDPSRLVFRIEKIVVDKIIDDNGGSKNIYYKALSDGEHQFAEVVGTMLMMEEEGCLFLFDEPDTHFNPKWRAKLLQTLNYMAGATFDDKKNVTSVRNQEVIITTHSPFVISDNDAKDVYCFEKKEGVVIFHNPDFQTYGASISIILNEIFDKKENISEMAKKELRDMVEGIRTIEDLKKVVERLNSDFGESADKLSLFSELHAIKDQLDKK